MDPQTATGVGTGVAGLLSWLNNNSSNSDSMQSLMSALGQAQGAIQTGADKAIGLQQPYTQNAGNDFLHLRDLVQKGYFQTPMQGSFTSQTPANNGFTFNPGQGSASFSPFQQQGGPATFTPQGLPQMPSWAPPAPQSPAMPQGGQTSNMSLRPSPTSQFQFNSSIPGINAPNSQGQSPQQIAQTRLASMNASPADAMRQYLQTHIGSGPDAPYNGGQAPQLNMPGPFVPGQIQGADTLTNLLNQLKQRSMGQYQMPSGGQYGL